MVGVMLLSQISKWLRQVKGDHYELAQQIFGGINVIALGDEGQLKPVHQAALYSHTLLQNPAFEEAQNVNGVSQLNGAWLWHQFNCVMKLVKSQRQANDLMYVDMLKRVRTGSCGSGPQLSSVQSIPDDITTLKTRDL